MPASWLSGGAAVVGALGGGLSSGGGSSTSTAPMSDEEKALIAKQTELAQAQLDNIHNLQPYQAQLVQQSMGDLSRSNQFTQAQDQAITPEMQANSAQQGFNYSQFLNSIQPQLLQMQMTGLQNGGAATDLQKQQIADATNASIDAGTGDIDTQTQRGIGMIADQLANERGLRLSDSPITGEAALLARAGDDQKASLIKNLRASQAQSVLNYPLQVQGLQANINSNQQNINNSVQQFQSQLQQQAYQNRLALTTPTVTTGLGLSGVSANTGSAIGSLNGSRGTTTDKTVGFGDQLSNVGNLAKGVGSIFNNNGSSGSTVNYDGSSGMMGIF